MCPGGVHMPCSEGCMALGIVFGKIATSATELKQSKWLKCVHVFEQSIHAVLGSHLV